MTSIASPSDTEPDLMTWDTIQYLPGNGDFARLIPTSRLARERFENLVSRIEGNPRAFPHARRMIHYEESFPEPQSPTDGSFVATEDTESRPSYCGFYRFNMNVRPGNVNLGWVLGSGRTDLPDNAVDLVLTPTPGTDGVHGRHCRLKRDLATGVLMLISDSRKVRNFVSSISYSRAANPPLLDHRRRQARAEARAREPQAASSQVPKSAPRTHRYHDRRPRIHTRVHCATSGHSGRGASQSSRTSLITCHVHVADASKPAIFILWLRCEARKLLRHLRHNLLWHVGINWAAGRAEEGQTYL